MTSNLIRQPDKYELASVVTKNSRTGITSNRRLLIIKGGKLYYYSTVPKNFTGDTKVLELSHQLPKCSIDIMNIKRVNGFDVSSPFFSIEFSAGNMMEKQDIRNSSMNENYNFSPKDTRQQITWQFTCDNQFIKQRWVTSLNHLIQYYKQQNLEMQNFMQNIQNNSSQVEQFKNSSNGSFSSRSSIRMPIPWRESSISRRSYNPDKGFEFKDSSNSPLNLQKIEDLSFLKKNPSDNNIINNSIDDHQFQMIIQEEPKRSLYKSRSEDVTIQRSQDPLKKFEVQSGSISIPLSVIQQPNIIKSAQLSLSSIISTSNPAPLSPILLLNTNPSLPITIQQLPEQSIPQTPIKQHSLSYREEQNYSIEGEPVEKTLADLKIFCQYQQAKIDFIENSDLKIEKQQFAGKKIQKDQAILQKSIVSGKQPDIQNNSVLEKLRFSQEQYPILLKQNPGQKEVSLQKAQSIQLQFGSSTSLEPIQISQTKTIKAKNQTAYHEQFYPFHYLWGEGLRMETKFNKKIDFQKQMVHQILNFKQRAIQSLADWIESKALGQNRYPIIEESSRFIVLQIANILLKVASITTQKININGAQKVFYNEENIKNFKRQFKIHQNLFKTISKRLRSQPSLKIRIPLSVLIQYRGVVCIATRQYPNQQSLHSVEEDEWNNQRNLLLEEGYKLQSFTYKRVGKYLQISLKTKGKNVDKDQQSFRQYLKKIVLIGRKEKHHNLIFDPPIDRTFLQIAAKQNASTSIESLQRYVKGLKLAKNLQGPCPKEQLIQTLQNCIFCKKLRKIYRSAQGQINETHFFNLIFKEQPAIINLLTQSDCEIPSKIRGQLFSFIQHYFGIILDIDEKVYQQHIQEKEKDNKKSKDIFISSTARPIVREYSLEGFQIIESWSKLTSYLQNKHPLGKSVLQTKREIFRMSEFLALDQHHELIYNQACLYYYEADYISCIKKCRQYQKSCPNKSTKLFLIYLLMMKSYSQFSETDFSVTLKKANDLIQFNYGPQNSSLVSLYSLAAFYYQKLSQKPNTKREPSLSQISLRLIKQAQQLCSNCFGNTSKQYVDILLDASRLYQSTDINISILYFEEVKKLCQENAFLCIPQTIVTVLSYEIELGIKRCLIAESEATLTHALTFLDSKISLKSKIHLYKLQYEVGICGENFNHCEAAIQRLWQLGTYEKLQALQLAYKAAFKHSGISECQNLIDQEDSIKFQSQQRALVTIQQQKYKNKSLIDTLINAIQNKDTHFLTLVYYLIRKY